MAQVLGYRPALLICGVMAAAGRVVLALSRRSRSGG
jgi:hypothetical protein